VRTGICGLKEGGSASGGFELPYESLPLTWVQIPEKLAAQSSDSEHITAPEARHYMHLDDPDLVVKAIRDLVRRCKQAR
jgi:pimeloyl-ACP methyl ester carboxylesterase